MPIVQQDAHGWWITWDKWNVITPTTVQVKNRDVWAEVALTGAEYTWSQEDDFHIWLSSIIGITQVISDSGVENFGPIDQHHYKQALFRKNVTSITAQLFGETNSGEPGYGWARGRLFLHFWS